MISQSSKKFVFKIKVINRSLFKMYFMYRVRFTNHMSNFHVNSRKFWLHLFKIVKLINIESRQAQHNMQILEVINQNQNYTIYLSPVTHMTYLFGSGGEFGFNTTCTGFSAMEFWYIADCCRRPLESAFHTNTAPD